MIRAPPLAVLLFLPPVLSHRSLASVPRAGALVACALEPPAECKGKCYTETIQSMKIHREREVFLQILLDFPGDLLEHEWSCRAGAFTIAVKRR